MLTAENKMRTMAAVVGITAVLVLCGSAKADSISDGQYLELSTWLFGHERQVTGKWGAEPWPITDRHTGVDYGAPEGTPLYSATDGEVIRVERGSSVDLSTLSIYHADTNTSFIYLHMETIEVDVPGLVQAGSYLGTVGERGYATGPHIHFESRAGWRTHAAASFDDTIKNPYQAARSARSASASPLSNIFAIDNRTGTGFRISSVSSAYSGVFAQGVDVTNTITAQVDWGWQAPSRVVFTLNGQSRTVNTSETIAQTEFNMGHDLSYSLSGVKNELTVQAIAANGAQSQIYTLYFWGLSLPQWATFGPIRPTFSGGTVNFKGDASFNAFKINGMANIPDTLPAIGGQWGIETDPLKINWDLSAYPLGSSLGADFSLGGKWGGSLKGGKNARGGIHTSLSGNGGFNPDFSLYSIDATLHATAGFDTPKARLPFCPIRPCPYFMASVDLGIAGTVAMEQGTPALIADLKFKQGTLALDATVSGTIGTQGWIFWAAAGTIGGRPSIKFQFPADEYNCCLNQYIQEISFVVLAQAEGRILWWDKEWSQEYLIYTCPQSKAMQFVPLYSTTYRSSPKIMSRDYLDEDEGYCVFPSISEGLIRPMAVGGLPEPILNVGPMPVPSVAATNDKGLLVFVYDDASKPTGKHQEIYFARWHNDQWTAHAPITDNLRPDTHPAAAIGSDGTEIVVWMQAPEITGAEQGPEDVIGGFEIVWSKYDAGLGTWQTTVELTSNSYFDGLPWFDSSVEGQLRVCWIASPTNAIALWDDDDIAPLVNLMAADWDGSAFGSPYMIAENLVTASHTAVGRTDAHEILAYLKDHDNNSATHEDVEVVVRTRPLGGSWSDIYYLTNDETIANIAVDIAVDAYGMPIVIWTSLMVPQMHPDGTETTTDQAWFSAFVDDGAGDYFWTEPELAFEYPGISEPTLFRNEAGKIVLYWTALSDDFVDVYYSVLDADYMTWSAAQQITFDQNAETMISLAESGGNILAAFVKRRIDMSDPEVPPQIGLSDIHLLEHIPSRDLSITAEDIHFSPAIMNDLAAFVEYWLGQDCEEPDWCGGFDLDQSGNVDLVDFMLFSNVFYSDVYPQPGRYTKVSADVYLAGDFTTHDIVVHFYDGDPDDGGQLIGTDTIDVMFPGNKHKAEVVWFMPEDMVSVDLYVVVDPENKIEETTTENNTAFVRPLKANLEARTIRAMGSPGADQVIVGFMLENRGNTAAENFTCQIRKDTEDGELLFSGQIDRINAGQTSGSQFVWDVSAEDADFKTLVLIVDTENTVDEIDEDNNVISRQVPVFADFVAEQWSVEVQGISAAILVRNAGPKPSLPTVVQVIRNDVVIGETAIGGLLSGESIEVEISLSEDVNYGRATFSVNPDQDQEEMTFENNTVEKIILISADFSGSGTVGLDDLLILAQYWLQDEPSVDIAPPGGDGIINMLDFAYMAELWMLASE